MGSSPSCSCANSPIRTQPIPIARNIARNLGGGTAAGLPPGLLKTFTAGKAEKIVLQEDLLGSRVIDKIPGMTGGSSSIGGRFFTTTKITSRAQAQEVLALDPAFNAARYIERAVIPKGTTIYKGTAAPLGSYGGGGVQIVVTDISNVSFYGIRRLQ